MAKKGPKCGKRYLATSEKIFVMSILASKFIKIFIDDAIRSLHHQKKPTNKAYIIDFPKTKAPSPLEN